MHITNDMIARDVMGWTYDAMLGIWIDHDDEGWHDPSLLKEIDPSFHKIFNPIADYNHCRLVEERIKELDLVPRYHYHLTNVVQAAWRAEYNYIFRYGGQLMYATAAQRCEAAYRAWKEYSDDQ